MVRVSSAGVSFPTGDDVRSPVIGTGGTVYVASDDGNLYAIADDSSGLGQSPWPMFRHDARHAGSVSTINTEDNGKIQTNVAPCWNTNITGKDIQLTHNSAINTSVKPGEGKGGNVTIDAATYVALENSDLTANADQGYGGDITINADAVFLSPDSDITASSQIHGKEGKIKVNSPVQDIVNAMVPLRESFLKADELLPESCETRDPEQTGSFIVGNNEGLPPRPDELLR